MIKLIFIDIDGVLNPINNVEREKKMGRKFINEMNLDPDTLGNLKTLVDSTGAKLILSSTWRLAVGKNNASFSNIELKLSEYGLKIHDITTRKMLGREKEIKLYLRKHPFSKFVIIDDVKMQSRRLNRHLALCDSHTGFDTKALLSAFKILS